MNLDSAVDQQEIATAYAARLHEVGIEIAAITDYNGVRDLWFSLIKSAAAEHGILVLPGAELSLAAGKKGVHLLAVFPEDTDTGVINEYLRSLQRQKATHLWQGRSHHDIDLERPLAAVLNEMRERFECLLIAAHGDGEKGIVESLGAEKAALLIDETDLDGVDHAGRSISKLRSTKVKRQWDHLACVEFSDPRSIADIGGKTLGNGTPRGTWLKLSSTTVEAMRLVLHDPETRVRTTEPAEPTNARITYMTVEGNGFLGNIELAFDPHLNNFIGGRGTGKSALLETIRYVLDLDPFCEEEQRFELVKHALGSGGSAMLEIERCSESGPAKCYQVKRVLGELPQVFDAGTGSRIDIAPRDTFGPDREPIILLQKEIEKISGSSSYRRELLDRLIGNDVRTAETAVDDARRRLTLNGTELRKHVVELGERSDLEAQAGKLQHELEIYRDNGVLDKLKVHSRMETLQRAIRSAGQLVEGKALETSEWQRSLQNARVEIEDKRNELRAHDDELTQAAEQSLERALSAVDAAHERIVEALRIAREELNAVFQRHKDRMAPLAEELNDIKKELHAEKLDAQVPLSLSANLAGVKAKLDNLDRKKPRGEELRHKRQGLLDELAKAREWESRVRQDAATTINSRLSQRLEVVVVPQGDERQFVTDLSNLLHGSSANTTAIESIAIGTSVDGPAIATALAEGANGLMDRYRVSKAQATKIYNWLTDESADRITELEALAPRDRVDIRLQVDGEGRSLDKLSTGQRATAILLLIFAVDSKCMILDQPEDDLDNRFIFEDVVRMIRDQKGQVAGGLARQIIAATHNPNIPVLGDAELVVVLEAHNDKVKIVAQGSIDSAEIRVHIRQVLEGGEEAFMRRYRKYGGIRRHSPWQPTPTVPRGRSTPRQATASA